MVGNKDIIKIQNLVVDSYASVMLDDLKKQLNSCTDIELIQEDKAIHDGEKCDLTLALNFAISVASSVISGIILDYLKSIFARNKHPKDYQWELLIYLDGCSKVTIQQEQGVVLVDFEKVTSEQLTEDDENA